VILAQQLDLKIEVWFLIRREFGESLGPRHHRQNSCCKTGSVRRFARVAKRPVGPRLLRWAIVSSGCIPQFSRRSLRDKLSIHVMRRAGATDFAAKHRIIVPMVEPYPKALDMPYSSIRPVPHHRFELLMQVRVPPKRWKIVSATRELGNLL
jgi:hypothetical protein